VTAIESAEILLKGQLAFLRNQGFDVELICGTEGDGSELDAVARREQIVVHSLRLVRGVSIVGDVRALVLLIRLLRSRSPDLVNVSTPKAGLLGGLAAVLTRVPIRVYLMRGLRVETLRGWKRLMLLALEAVSCRCAHHVVCVSPSLRSKLLALRLVQAKRTLVLGSGASNGVDIERFSADATLQSEARILREGLGINEDTFVVGFVGRIVRDKGIAELVEAFLRLLKDASETDPGSHLVVVGQFEENDRIDIRTRSILEQHPSISLVPWTDPAVWYLVMDAVVLPTFREGFPNVPLEAGAAGRPVVTTNATGAIDSVVHGVTGAVVPCGDIGALERSMRELRDDPGLRARLGESGRKHVAASFTNEEVWARTGDFYRSLLPKTAPQVSDWIA
jgi:glycosyltransferase involved in cell wall biosynthesis